MNKKYIIAGVLAILILGSVVFFFEKRAAAPAWDNRMGGRPMMGDKQDGNTMGKPANQLPVDYNAPVTDAKAPVKEFTVTGKNFSFAPNTISVKKGDHVKITFMNADGFHDLKIDEYKVATPRVQTGGSATVEFIADKVGSFQYYCSVGNHRAMGMFGTLTVQ